MSPPIDANLSSISIGTKIACGILEPNGTIYWWVRCDAGLPISDGFVLTDATLRLCCTLFEL